MQVKLSISDPPWFYNDRRDARKDNSKLEPRFGYGAQGNYSLGCMKLKDLISLGPIVKEIHEDNSYHFMWATMPLLKEAITLLESWGFTYKGCAFIWVKRNSKANTPFSGPGYYTPANAEVILLGVRGKPWHSTKGEKPNQIQYEDIEDWDSCVVDPQAIVERHPRCNRGKIIHSRKPEIFQDILEKGWGAQQDLPLLELFATRIKPNWVCLGYDTTGNTIDKDLEMFRDSSSLDEFYELLRSNRENES